MTKCKGSISEIETLGLVDGPGIRTVVFLNGCKLRCKFCHNPETWIKKDDNTDVNTLVNKILRMRPYYKDNGGVTFSGGEPLLQSKFLIKVCQKLKNKNIHIALDTAGVGYNYKKLLRYIDLIILDIKHVTAAGYKDITRYDIKEVEKFIKIINKTNKDVWIRQVIIPDVNDNYDYLLALNEYLKKIKNIKKIEFLPFHNMAISKYKKLNIKYPYKNKKAMDKTKTEKLYQEFMKIRNT